MVAEFQAQHVSINDNLFPDGPPPPSLTPKLTAEERQRRQAGQLMRIRFRVMIGRELEERGIAMPAEIGAALEMMPAEATALLSRHQWREGDLLLLEAAANRLGVQVPGWNRTLGACNLDPDPPSPGDKPHHQLTEIALEGQFGGPSYTYRGARIDCMKGGMSAA